MFVKAVLASVEMSDMSEGHKQHENISDTKMLQNINMTIPVSWVSKCIGLSSKRCLSTVCSYQLVAFLLATIHVELPWSAHKPVSKFQVVNRGNSNTEPPSGGWFIPFLPGLDAHVRQFGAHLGGFQTHLGLRQAPQVPHGAMGPTPRSQRLRGDGSVSDGILSLGMLTAAVPMTQPVHRVWTTGLRQRGAKTVAWSFVVSGCKLKDSKEIVSYMYDIYIYTCVCVCLCKFIETRAHSEVIPRLQL